MARSWPASDARRHSRPIHTAPRFLAENLHRLAHERFARVRVTLRHREVAVPGEPLDRRSPRAPNEALADEEVPKVVQPGVR